MRLLGTPLPNPQTITSQHMKAAHIKITTRHQLSQEIPATISNSSCSGVQVSFRGAKAPLGTAVIQTQSSPIFDRHPQDVSNLFPDNLSRSALNSKPALTSPCKEHFVPPYFIYLSSVCFSSDSTMLNYKSIRPKFTISIKCLANL